LRRISTTSELPAQAARWRGEEPASSTLNTGKFYFIVSKAANTYTCKFATLHTTMHPTKTQKTHNQK
jgi:hypothetical protein